MAGMPARPQYSDEAIIIGLRVKSVERGRTTGATGPVPITATWWDLHRDKRNHPPSPTVMRRFGSWTKACEAAGIPVRALGKVGRPQRWTDAEMLELLHEFLSGPRRKDTSYSAYAEWARLRKARPSGAAILKRFGSWGRAKERALTATPSGHPRLGI
jgi:hypothetical protein